MQKAIVILSFLFIGFCSTSCVSTEAKVHWLTVDELQVAYKKEPRPILIDVYTSWCGWCKVMEAQTYTNDSVADYINQHYYAVKFDAETATDVKWQDRVFPYNPHYKVNEFSLFITNGQMSYPTTVLLPGINGPVSPLSGFLKPGEIEAPLKYFGEGMYPNTTYPDFQKTFSATW